MDNDKKIINEKGGILNLVIIMIMSVFFIILFYVIIQIYIPVTSDILFPILENVPYGSLITLIFQFLLLIIVILFIIIVIKESGVEGRSSGGPI